MSLAQVLRLRMQAGCQGWGLTLAAWVWVFGTEGRNRTVNLRFWRPPLCQLSYLDAKFRRWPVLISGFFEGQSRGRLHNRFPALSQFPSSGG